MQLEFNDLSLSDLLQVEKVHDGSYPLPNVNNNLYIVQKSIKLDNKVIGAAFVHVTTEISLVLNKEISNISRMRVILALMELLIEELGRFGYEDTHTFIVPENDEHYAKILEKLGFVRATGIPMYYQKGQNVQSQSSTS